MRVYASLSKEKQSLIHYADYDVFMHTPAFLIGNGRFMIIINFNLTTDKKGYTFR